MTKDIDDELTELIQEWKSTLWHDFTLGQRHQWLYDVAVPRTAQEWCRDFVQALKDFGLPDEWCEMHLDANGQISSITRDRFNCLLRKMTWLTRRLKQGESLGYPPEGVFSGETPEEVSP